MLWRFFDGLAVLVAREVREFVCTVYPDHHGTSFSEERTNKCQINLLKIVYSSMIILRVAFERRVFGYQRLPNADILDTTIPLSQFALGQTSLSKINKYPIIQLINIVNLFISRKSPLLRTNLSKRPEERILITICSKLEFVYPMAPVARFRLGHRFHAYSRTKCGQ